MNSFVICNAANVQAFPDVACGGGTYLVGWSDSRLTGLQYNIYATRVSTGGAVLDPAGLQVGTAAATTQLCPSIAFSGSRFLVVWGNYAVPGNVYGRFVYPDGTMNDTFRIATANYVYGTDVAYSGTNYLVVWTEEGGGGYGLRGQLVSISGSPIGSRFTIANEVEYYLSVHACYDGANYFVVYADAAQSGTHQIYARRYNTSGMPVGGVISVSNSSYPCYYPNAAAGPNNRYLNVWDEERGSHTVLYGNVDVTMVDVQDEIGAAKGTRKPLTIIRGKMNLPAGESYRVYDGSGRKVDPTYLAPGVYFVGHEGKIVRKIVKIE